MLATRFQPLNKVRQLMKVQPVRQAMRTKVDKTASAYEQVEDIFGKHYFNPRAQRNYLSPDVFKQIQERVVRFEPITPELCEAYAAGLLRWAMFNGVTHYTHWFTPLTGASASKHDSFLRRSGDHVISGFSGKDLSRGETDGSSFPSGGLRSTHTARAYTIWDPTSHPFLIDHGNGATLYIPALFLSWKGDPLDEKTPLLRSNAALNTAALAFLPPS